MREKIKAMVRVMRTEGMPSQEWKLDADVDEIYRLIAEEVEEMPLVENYYPTPKPNFMPDSWNGRYHGFNEGASVQRDDIARKIKGE